MLERNWLCPGLAHTFLLLNRRPSARYSTKSWMFCHSHLTIMKWKNRCFNYFYRFLVMCYPTILSELNSSSESVYRLRWHAFEALPWPQWLLVPRCNCLSCTIVFMLNEDVFSCLTVLCTGKWWGNVLTNAFIYFTYLICMLFIYTWSTIKKKQKIQIMGMC